MSERAMLMGVVDCHNHTNFSCDASHTAEETFQAARNRGLGGVCITDHFDLHVVDGVINQERSGVWGSDTGWTPIPTHHLTDCCELWEQRSARLRCTDVSFKQLFGVELGCYPGSSVQLKQFAEACSFDQVTGSMHTFSGSDLNVVYDDLYRLPQGDVYRNYLRDCIELVREHTQIDVLGHFDYVSRYAVGYDDPKMYYHDFSDEFDELFKLLIDRGVALEVNTAYTKVRMRRAGVDMSHQMLAPQRFSDATYMMDAQILQRYNELGGSLIVLGSDSHKPEDTGLFFMQHIEHLRRLGFTSLTYFVQRQPQGVLLQKTLH